MTPTFIPLKFRVIRAEYETLEQRASNGVMGPGYASHLTGIIPQVTLSVEPDNGDVKTRTLTFIGYCNLQGEDKIIAHISKSDLMEDYKEIEKVSKLEKIGEHDRILATFNGLKF